MTGPLGTLEELPADYRAALTGAGVSPLWPYLRNLLPPDRPAPVTQSCHWSYAHVRPLLLKAGELTPVEKAERRVLVLSDPGRGPAAMQATATIYAGLQLLLPGEVAPNHRHIPSAARIVVEGDGAYTVVNGEKLPMEPGDVILTPNKEWHDHRHVGNNPVVWLDVLDLPLFVSLEAAYSEGAKAVQVERQRPDASQVEYRVAGLVPARSDGELRRRFPLLRFPWSQTEQALRDIARYAGREIIAVDLVNPETGDDPLPTIGFTALMLPASHQIRPVVRSSSAVIHIIKGSGQSVLNGVTFKWQEKDSFSVPGFAKIEHRADEEPAFLIEAHDRPLQRRLGFYEERTNDA